jgi:hypothetical protein
MIQAVGDSLGCGEDLRRRRAQLGVSQQQLADILKVSKAAVGLCELQNRPIPKKWHSTVELLDRIVQLSDWRPKPRKRSWRNSKVFGKIPTFSELPPCPCGIPGCALDADSDVERGPLGHLWRFNGRLCYKRRYVNEDGLVVPSPLAEEIVGCPNGTLQQMWPPEGS